MARSAYEELESRYEVLSRLSSMAALLRWDSAIFMPPGATVDRSDDLVALETIRHHLGSNQEHACLLAEAESRSEQLNSWQRANLKEMRRLWMHDSAVDPELARAIVKLSGKLVADWKQARKDNNFLVFLPGMEIMVTLQREIAEAKADYLGVTPYEALMDAYEPGARCSQIDVLFDELAAYLPDLLNRVAERNSGCAGNTPVRGPFDISSQIKFCTQLVREIGYDFDRGRLDQSDQAFTLVGLRDDVRIAVRFCEDDFSCSITAAIHETGHAIYELGRPARWYHQPVGRSRGGSIHESQALMYAMIAGRSREFISYLAPLVIEAFGGAGPAWELPNIARSFLQVKPSLIRVNADEISYPLHVILRYRLEQALLNGDLSVCDLPGAWNDGMVELLGVAPDSDAQGCLQDVHWSRGLFGYFPVYALGALTAAQLYQAACASSPDIQLKLSCGDFSPLTSWVRKNIHKQVSRYDTNELIARASGNPLGTEALKTHLKQRYLHETVFGIGEK